MVDFSYTNTDLQKMVDSAKTDLKNNVQKDVITLNCSVNQALEHLYAAFHLPNAHEPEYAVFNPNPQHFVKEFLLPRDMYFWEESNSLTALDLPEFQKACKKYIRNKGVKHISAIVDLDTEGKFRLTALAEFNLTGNVPTSASVTLGVSGGLAREREMTLKKTYGAICQALQT